MDIQPLGIGKKAKKRPREDTAEGSCNEKVRGILEAWTVETWSKGRWRLLQGENTVTQAYAMYRDNELTDHLLNATLSSGIVYTGTPNVSPTVLSGAAIGKARDCNKV